MSLLRWSGLQQYAPLGRRVNIRSAISTCSRVQRSPPLTDGVSCFEDEILVAYLRLLLLHYT